MRHLNTNFTLGNCLLGFVKPTNNVDLDKYKYAGFNIGFGFCLDFLFTDGIFGKNAIIFGADMSASVHFDNKRKNISILGEGPTQGLNDTTLTAEAIYSISFTQPNKRFVLSLNYNENSSFSFVNGTKYINSKLK